MTSETTRSADAASSNQSPAGENSENPSGTVLGPAARAMRRIALDENRSIRKTISESDVYLFAGITGDLHPNHTDAVYAAEGLGGRVMHGALLPGFISRCTVELIGERLDPPGYAAQSFSVKCVAPIFIGDTITVEVAVAHMDFERRKIRVEARVMNQDGKTCALGDSVIKVLRGDIPC